MKKILALIFLLPVIGNAQTKNQTVDSVTGALISPPISKVAPGNGIIINNGTGGCNLSGYTVALPSISSGNFGKIIVQDGGNTIVIGNPFDPSTAIDINSGNFTVFTDGTFQSAGATLTNGTVNTLAKFDSTKTIVSATAGTDYEVPLTFSGGASRSGNTITINASDITTGTLGAAYVATLNQNTTGSAGSFTGLLIGDVTGGQSTTKVSKLSNLTTNGFVKTGSGNGTLSIDTNTYLTGNQTITLSGDVTGTGTTSIPVTVTKINGTTPDPSEVTAIGNATNTGSGLVTQTGGDARYNPLLTKPVFLMANFGDYVTAGTERAQLLMSSDAVNWVQINGLNNYNPPSGGIRDVGFTQIGSTYFITYTIYFSASYPTGCAPYFGVAKSTDLINWTHVADITPSGNTDPIADPKWFIDSNGNRYVTYYNRTTGAVYLIQNTSTDGTTWAAPSSLSLPNLVSGFDPYMFKIGSTYHVVAKINSHSSYFHDWTSTNLSTWTDNGAITNWGFGENPTVFVGPDGNFWCELNNQVANPTYFNYVYSTNSTSNAAVASWSALSNVNQPPLALSTTGGGAGGNSGLVGMWDGGTVIPVSDPNTLRYLTTALAAQTQLMPVSYASATAVGAGTPSFSGVNGIGVSKLSAASTRELIFSGKVSDAPNDLLSLYNATTGDTIFVPAVGGFVNTASNKPALQFTALCTSTNDTGTTPMVVSQVAQTTSTSDPFNGTFSAITTRPAFRWQTGTTSLLNLYSGGGFYLGSTPSDPGAGNFQAEGTGKFVAGIIGTSTNDSASSGNVGQIVTSAVASGSPQTLSTGTAANVTSISLTAGDWDVEGNINFIDTAATVTETEGGIGSTSATLPTDGTEVYSGVQLVAATTNDGLTLPRKRITISSTTTIYLVASQTFTGTGATAFGSITARRVR